MALLCVTEPQSLNALQQLIADYLADHPVESYSSIARRAGDGMPRQTVHAIAKKGDVRQTNQPRTIERLARGMDMEESRVRAAAGLAAGFAVGVGADQFQSPSAQLLMQAIAELDAEKLDALC